MMLAQIYLLDCIGAKHFAFPFVEHVNAAMGTTCIKSDQRPQNLV